MKIKNGEVIITWDSGKSITLTEKEFDELKEYFKEVVYLPSFAPIPCVDPKWPYSPPVVTWGYGDPTAKAKQEKDNEK